MNKTRITIIFVIQLLLYTTTVHAQHGGVRHLFSYGVGARALSLGGAGVADPRDPSAIVWNPGGLDFIQEKSVTAFYANMVTGTGTSLDFVGYVHPTSGLGTFGFGIIRIGSGDAEIRGLHNEPGGSFSFDQQEFIVSYAKQVLPLLSVGANVKLEREQMAGFSDTALGADIGVLYKPQFSSVFLRDISLGLSVSNIVRPGILLRKANEPITPSRESMPYTVRLGFAKPIPLGAYGNVAMLYCDFDKGQYSSFRFHCGAEYVFRKMAMLRIGINDGTLAFGAGASYGSFQLDYSYGWLDATELAPNHKISFTYSFGKTKDELIRLANDRRMREIEEATVNAIRMRNRTTIMSGLRDGNAEYEKGNFGIAYAKYTSALSVEDTLGLDEDVLLARREAARKRDLIDEQLREERNREAERRFVARQEQEELAFIEEHSEKGLAFLGEKKYIEAIEEFDRILERRPDHEQTVRLKDQAIQAQRDAVNALILQGDRASRRPGGNAEANRIYRDAAEQARGQADLVTLINGKIRQLNASLNFDLLYQQGIEEKRAGNYTAAMEAFRRALEIEPNNELVRQHYEEARAWSQAKDVRPTGEAGVLYKQGYSLLIKGKYNEALPIFEEANRLQPHVLIILQAIDHCKKQISKEGSRE